MEMNVINSLLHAHIVSNYKVHIIFVLHKGKSRTANIKCLRIRRLTSDLEFVGMGLPWAV